MKLHCPSRQCCMRGGHWGLTPLAQQSMHTMHAARVSSSSPSPCQQATARCRGHSVRCNSSMTGNGRVPSTGSAAAAQRLPPHSGYHFDGSSRRFFEGWYWRVTDPKSGDSFALMFSVEDPGNPEATYAGVGIQVMGPGDGYICQYTRDTGAFWAGRNSLELGACAKPRPGVVPGKRIQRMMSEAEFNSEVEHGFQASATWQQGNLVSTETGATGPPMSTVNSASWAVSIRPEMRWGSEYGSQKPTAGWLSLLSVFEPHWQVLMAHGVADGWLQWGDKRYEFSNAPAYAEKNWGGGFPSKWIWVQCNTFEGYPGLAVTAVGARRGLALGVGGLEEDVGMVGVHVGGEFLELVPWDGEVEWSADPWGRWWIRAKGSKHEALVEATCGPEDGAVLRAPSAKNGLAPMCKDTFAGQCRLRVWELDSLGNKASYTMVDATSKTAALEVGGGPWWAPWGAKAKMLEPLRSLVRLPLDVNALSALPQPLRPPGL